ncbi:hypothetical protein DEE50_06230 [Burkholderia cepacia]|uniref:Uncharacterized protein n=1 Tax=Burkholderia cepacia TaxID=292 RepID=A0A8I1AU39_BURCE|nr:hypothetical protein [Burkholderia cepacia]MBH9713922.1 hypothetical protein [Burkholderia cepacia]MBX3759559.1 hypothetical protein [Burkholderia cepacia]MBX3799625.1 hypothetical protein [Burkholderia cepacia]MBX3906521.1 hypothetical protein [Burkholderia cepacia]
MFRHLKHIVNVDAEVSASALKPCMPGQKLNGPQVLRSPIDQGDPFPPHGVRAIRRVVQAEGRDPAMNQPSVLSASKDAAKRAAGSKTESIFAACFALRSF